MESADCQVHFHPQMLTTPLGNNAKEKMVYLFIKYFPTIRTVGVIVEEFTYFVFKKFEELENQVAITTAENAYLRKQVRTLGGEIYSLYE